MRFRTHSVLGVALLVSGVAGCGVTQNAASDSQIWSWQNRDSMSRSTAQWQYGLLGDSNTVAPSLGAQPAGTKPSDFDFSNPRVDTFLTRFQTRLRSSFSQALSRSGRYVSRMSSILQKEGVPQQLAYLPLIESGFSVHAVSRAGAVGPWQLISGTGRRYGLRIDAYVDERRDPVKSTQAAARYLKDLYNMFGDWHLSLAAYNTGEGTITRILERGRADDFWEMSARGYLYRETRDFVPGFLAALQIAETPEAYGFDTPDEEPMQYDRVKISRSLSLTTVAQLSGTSTDMIKELNPALHRGVVPPEGYPVRLPKGTKEAFQIAYANYEENAVRFPRSTSAPRGGTRRQRIRRGETVASIAAEHFVSLAQLQCVNRVVDLSSERAVRTLAVPPREVIPLLVADRYGGRVLD